MRGGAKQPTNKLESRYFNTARLMDEALISLLEEKDFEYITVKEICERAGVNRSTFYLHYETLDDLVREAAEMVNERFVSYFPQELDGSIDEFSDRGLEDLFFITGEYLKPYLQFIRDNKNIYRATLRNPDGMRADAQYKNLRDNVIEPVLERFKIPSALRKYFVAFYIEGLVAIIKEWLSCDCQDSAETVVSAIEECIGYPYGA